VRDLNGPSKRVALRCQIHSKKIQRQSLASTNKTVSGIHAEVTVLQDEGGGGGAEITVFENQRRYGVEAITKMGSVLVIWVGPLDYAARKRKKQQQRM